MADFAPHNMVNNTSPAPFEASASTSYSLLPPWMAFNGTLGISGYWVTNGVSTGWLKLDIGLGNSKILGSYNVVVNTAPEPNRAPKNWTLEGSNNNTNWDILDTVTNQINWSSGESRNFICDVTTTAYRWFRINVTANNGDTYLQVGELYLYEYENFKAHFSIDPHAVRKRYKGRYRSKSIIVLPPFNRYWSGLVVTVGTGKNFSSLDSAVTYANSKYGTLILVDPGNYTLPAIPTPTNGMIIRGLGQSPDDTILNRTSYAIDVQAGGRVLIENVKLVGTNAWNAGLHCYSTAIVDVNKCHIYTPFSDRYIISGYQTGFSGKLVVKNCKLTRGYAHLFSINLSLISLIRVELNDAMYTYQCTGSLVSPDTVITPTVDYGYTYGSFFVRGVRPLM